MLLQGEVTTSAQVNNLNITRYLCRNQCRYIRSHVIEIEEGSSSLIALYVDSCLCGFVLSWQDAPPYYCEHSIWDREGFYTMHIFLNLLFESQFKSFLKPIIPLWYHTSYYCFSTLQVLSLAAYSSSMLLSLCTVPRLV
jgi:hypothetical protein